MISSKRMVKVVAVATVVMLTVGPVVAEVAVDSGLPGYKTTKGVSGSVKSIGSDTMNNLMALWSEGFRGIYPSVQVEIEGTGSSTAPPALISGTATFVPMSREMKAAEIRSLSAIGSK